MTWGRELHCGWMGSIYIIKADLLQQGKGKQCSFTQGGVKGEQNISWCRAS